MPDDVVVNYSGQVKNELLPEAKEEHANVLQDTRRPAQKERFSRPEDLGRATDKDKANVFQMFSYLVALSTTGGSVKRWC